MSLQETYSPAYTKFESYFEHIIHRLAELKPKLFRCIDLEDFKIFFEAPISKGKNKGSPRLYSIFNQYLKNSQMKFSDETYVENVCLALIYDKMKLANGLDMPIYKIMLKNYSRSAHRRITFTDYSTLENESYTDDVASYLEIKDLKDILYRRVFEARYLDKYFNGPDLMMLKNYLKSLELNCETNIKNFTNNYEDCRMLSAKAYDTRLRNMYKAWAAFSIVKFDIWDALERYFGHDLFKSFQDCADFLNSLKPLKERKAYFKQKLKQKEAETSTSEDPKLRYPTLKEYLVKKFGPVNVKEVDGGFVVDKEWCLKYFLNGGFVNLKTGEKGSWLSLVQ